MNISPESFGIILIIILFILYKITYCFTFLGEAFVPKSSGNFPIGFFITLFCSLKD